MLQNKPPSHTPFHVFTDYPLREGKASECSQLGMWDALEKIKIVYQSGKCPLSNFLRIINYLIPPLEEVARASM